MKLYKISQTLNRGYDTYDSAIVCAKDEEEARNIHPEDRDWDYPPYSSTWCNSPDQVTVELIGTAAPGTRQGVMLASFNAG
jgi:hypothetical protein